MAKKNLGNEPMPAEFHEHNWNGRRHNRAGAWTNRAGGGQERATWTAVQCTCGHWVGETDHNIETRG